MLDQIMERFGYVAGELSSDTYFPYIDHIAPTVMLLADNSSSMAATDVSPTRLVAAERAAQSFLATVPKDVAVGVIVFN